MEEQADRVATALAQLKVRRALLVGHSTGGEVAVALAARHPEAVRRLVVMDTEPDERYVDTDLLAELSVTPVISSPTRPTTTPSTSQPTTSKRGASRAICAP